MSETVQKFYDNEPLYRSMDLKHKMGCLFYGSPGNGKSMIIREMIKKYKNNSVVIFIDEDFPTSLIKKLKHYDSSYIFIFEELTQIMSDQREIAHLLLFLDGEYSLDRQLTLATTNYPEHLPANLASRPGRFDKLIEVGDPSSKVRKMYMESLLKKEVSENVVQITKNMSIAYLKEIIISSIIDGIELEEAIKINKARIERVKKSFAPAKKTMGLL